MGYSHRKTFTYHGRRYDIKGNSEYEVNQKMLKKMRELEMDKRVNPTGITLAQWAMECFELYKRPSVKDITYERYISRLNSCILNHIGFMRLDTIERKHLQECVNKQAGNSKYQIRQTIQFIRFIFNQAVIDGLIDKNPSEGIFEPSGYTSKRRALTGNEEEVFLKCCKADIRYNIFLVTYYCGCRPEEARNLLTTDIVKKNGINMLHIQGSKSASANRSVPIPDELMSILDRSKKILCPNTKGRKLDTKAYYRAWHSLCRAMNIEMGCEVYRNALIPPYPLADDLTPYCLRHTYCTNLAKAGVDIRTAQYLMGHSDIALTANIYTHIDETQIAKAAELLSTSCGK